MKRHFLFIIAIVLSHSSYSQIFFKKGYFIDNANQKTICLIKTIDWNNNPTRFEYKLSEQSELKNATLESVKEFGVNGVSKYIRVNVNIDRSNEAVNELSKERNPIFKEEKLFLKVLIEGKATLYEYLHRGLTRYFYKIENSNVEQLVFKSYKTAENKIAENNMFKQQLLDGLKCPDFKIDDFKNLDYDKNDLVRIFTKYNQCLNWDITYFEQKIKQDFFNLNIRPRFNSSSLTLENSGFNSRDVIEFGNKTGIGIGLEAEIVLPIKKNKWTVLIEPTYQSFKAETINNDVSVIFRGEIKSKVDYTSIEVPIGLRHYFFLKNNSSIFVNASYVFDVSSNSFFEFDRSDTPNTIKENIDTYNQNLAFGMGYKLKNKYSLEVRYQISRELIKNNLIWSSDYKTFSVIFGYSIF